MNFAIFSDFPSARDHRQAPEARPAEGEWRSDEERYRSFGAAIDGIRKRAAAKVGATDLRRVRRLDRLSRTLEVAGRGLIGLSPGPLSFGVGVVALWLHRQLQATEIGHTVLHGAYNRIEGAGRFHSKRFRWQIPIDEPSWIRGHNGRHHGLTNVAGQDPDIHFGPIRLTADTPHRTRHYFQLPFALFVLFPNFTFGMNLHFTGCADAWGSSGGGLDVLPDRSRASVRGAYRRALRKFVPYYGKEYLLMPGLAAALGVLVFGPVGLAAAPLVFAKVALGNYLSELMRDLYTAATIYCGHVGGEVAHYPEGTRPRSKGERYAMQVEASNNFEVSRGLSVLCGALDLQIEHHLFPSLPPERLREVASEVEAVARAHGVTYRSASWGATLAEALTHIARLSVPQAEDRAKDRAEDQAEDQTRYRVDAERSPAGAR